MEMDSCVPPGFRFHPTEEELVDYYLKRRINSQKIDLDVIIDIDLYRMEPWDIQGSCKLGYEEQNGWYFFSHKDRKYPTGTRANRATAAGFWKATGRDKAVVSKDRIIGMRKTLVYYKGRAPNGRKTDWIMHEFSLQNSENGPPQPQEEGWVVCRAFMKPTPSTQKQGFESRNNPNYYRPQSYPCTSNKVHTFDPINHGANFQLIIPNHTRFQFQLPKPDSASISATKQSFEHNAHIVCSEDDKRNYDGTWKNFDKLLAPQVIDHSYQRVELPKLDIPSKLKKESLAHNTATGCSEDMGDKKRKYDNNWNNFDQLLASQVSDEHSSYAYTNLQPLVPQNDELGWLPDLKFSARILE